MSQGGHGEGSAELRVQKITAVAEGIAVTSKAQCNCLVGGDAARDAARDGGVLRLTHSVTPLMEEVEKGLAHARRRPLGGVGRHPGGSRVEATASPGDECRRESGANNGGRRGWC